MDKDNKFAEIEGREMSYANICKAIGEPTKTGASKMAQMKEWEKYCCLEKIDGTHRYLIKEAYGDETSELMRLLDIPEQQLLFEAALCRAFKANGYKSLCLSNTETLKLFEEVNDNFSYTFNPKQLAKINRNFVYMADMSKTVYRILYKWTRRKLEAMENRGVILLRRGFRAYYKQTIDGVEYTMYKNMPMNSIDEKRCQRVWVNALCELYDVDYVMDAPVGWMPEAQWHKFEELIAKHTQAEFKDEGYTYIRWVTIISGMPADYVDKMIDTIQERIGNAELINAEAKRKVLMTTQLDAVCTNTQRQEFIDYNMTPNPPRWFNERKEKERRG